MFLFQYPPRHHVFVATLLKFLSLVTTRCC